MFPEQKEEAQWGRSSGKRAAFSGFSLRERKPSNHWVTQFSSKHKPKESLSLFLLTPFSLPLPCLFLISHPGLCSSKCPLHKDHGEFLGRSTSPMDFQREWAVPGSLISRLPDLGATLTSWRLWAEWGSSQVCVEGEGCPDWWLLCHFLPTLHFLPGLWSPQTLPLADSPGSLVLALEGSVPKL